MSLRSCARRKEGQNGLLPGAGGWKTNQPGVPSNSRKKPGNCIERLPKSCGENLSEKAGFSLSLGTRVMAQVCLRETL